MTKIVVIRPYASLPSEGGSNDRYINLCKSLIKQGAEVRFFCSDFMHNSKRRRKRVEKEVNHLDYPFIVQLRTLVYHSDLSFLRIMHEVFFGVSSIFYLLSKPKPDVIVVSEPLFGVGWIILLYGLFFRVPVIADIIDLWPEADRSIDLSFRRRLTYKLLKFSRYIRLRCYRAVSFVSRSYAEQLGFEETQNIFYLASELSPTKPHVYPDSRLHVIYAGSFGVGYDIQTVLKTAEKVRQELPGRFHFMIAGDGPQLGDVKHAHGTGAIEYLGVLDRGTLVQRYEMSDVGILPYKFPSMVAMPTKFFDYMNFGLYTITSIMLEAGKTVKKYNIGDTYHAGDVDDLYGKLKTVDENRAVLSRTRDVIAPLAKSFSAEEQYSRFAYFILGHARGNR